MTYAGDFAMSYHDRQRTEADYTDWRPRPIALLMYLAGISVLGWSAYDFSQRADKESLTAKAEQWRPAPSKWAREAKSQRTVFRAAPWPAGSLAWRVEQSASKGR